MIGEIIRMATSWHSRLHCK